MRNYQVSDPFPSVSNILEYSYPQEQPEYQNYSDKFINPYMPNYMYNPPRLDRFDVKIEPTPSFTYPPEPLSYFQRPPVDHPYPPNMPYPPDQTQIQSLSYENILFSDDTRGRAENWQHEETKVFIRLLVLNKKEFENIRKNQNLWELIAQELTNRGYHRNVEKCKNRWKVLVAKYKRYEEKSRSLGLDPATRQRDSNPIFEYYEELRELLGTNYAIAGDGTVRRLKKKHKNSY